ncbi:hypothetical protein BLD25_01000 [Candidatus Gracilibacteria bacterium GN02-872]|nr:hypothetical protein BLD25_01000 [Candidatus Gracilibacteria bacterium GN02-872]
MPNYKLSVSKDNKRYSIIFKADNEAIARERVHREGYSILGIEELKDQENVGNTFLFEAYKNGELKYGKIAGDDIFKVYVNLVKNLEYDVVHVYSEKDKGLSTEQKDRIVEELKEEYNLFFQKRRDKIDDLRDKIKKEKGEDINIDQFYMKKELEDVNKLIVHVLVKLESMILGNSIVKLDLEQKQKLENIYNSIIKLKKSTNISKLREIGERALQKIGKLELEKLEETKDDKNRELLKETNKLLKELGSKDRFIEKDRDFGYQTKQFFDYLKSFFVKKKKIKQENVEIDKESHSYVKNQLYLSKYEEKLRENRIYTTKNFFKLLFNKELREMNSLKRSVIKQNIFLLKSRLEGKTISYSFVSKGFLGIFSTINGMIDFLKNNLFYIIFIYIILFLLLLNLTYTFGISFNYNISGVFLFLILLFAYIFISFSKNIFFVILNFALFVFIVILGVINF